MIRGYSLTTPSRAAASEATQVAIYRLTHLRTLLSACWRGGIAFRDDRARSKNGLSRRDQSLEQTSGSRRTGRVG